MVMLIFFSATARRDRARRESQVLCPPAATASFVTPTFELSGRKSNVEVATRTNNDNNWMFFGYSLINADTGQAWDFGREVSYYHGHDSDGDWTEGSPTIGNYSLGALRANTILRVEPEGDPEVADRAIYQIVVRRDVPFILASLIAARAC